MYSFFVIPKIKKKQTARPIELQDSKNCKEKEGGGKVEEPKIWYLTSHGTRLMVGTIELFLETLYTKRCIDR